MVIDVTVPLNGHFSSIIHKLFVNILFIRYEQNHDESLSLRLRNLRSLLTVDFSHNNYTTVTQEVAILGWHKWSHYSNVLDFFQRIRIKDG